MQNSLTLKISLKSQVELRLCVVVVLVRSPRSSRPTREPVRLVLSI